MTVLQQFNKLILQCDLGVLSYSLELLAKVLSTTQESSKSGILSMLEASMERVTPKEDSVQFYRTGVVADRTLGKFHLPFVATLSFSVSASIPFRFLELFNPRPLRDVCHIYRRSWL